jgi:hypothetical protein
MSRRKIPAGAAPMLIAVVMATSALVACSGDDTAQPGQALVLTDNLTGCQYVGRTGGGLINATLEPRRRADGHQVCEQSGQAR